MRLKICGITHLEQGQAIAHLGATALGFICVATSPRYVTPSKIQEIVANLPKKVDKIGVFANSNPIDIQHIAQKTGLTGIQLHGNESPDDCQAVKDKLPYLELIKAFRVKNIESLAQISTYYSVVDTLLLDAYHPQQLGGTGHRINEQLLPHLTFALPWFLAGGLTSENILDILQQVQPNGLDVSSGVEQFPGHKDLNKVQQFLGKLQDKNYI